MKVTPQPTQSNRDHWVVCLVEIKRDDDTIVKAYEQMGRYMEQLAEHPSREGNLRGYLVAGNWVTVFSLEDDGDGIQVVQEQPFDMFAPGDRFTQELGEIAVRNWN